MAEPGRQPPFTVVTGPRAPGPGETQAPPPGDSGLYSLAMVAAHYRIASDPAQMSHDLGLGERMASAGDLVRAARRIGLKSTALTGQKEKRLQSVPLPSILGMKDG